MRLEKETAQLSPKSLRERHLAVLKENRSLRKDLSALRAKSAMRHESSSSKAVPPCFVFLYASPLCFLRADKRCMLLPQLDAESEMEKLQRALGGYPVEIEVASTSSLMRTVKRRGVWLHICAHTVEVAPGQWRCMLEDQGVRPVASQFSPQDIETLLQVDGKKACGSFVFNAMCHSNIYREAFRRAGFTHIVDCESEVKDRHAAEFAHDLYTALRDGESLNGAFIAASISAKGRGDPAVYHLEGDGSARLPPPSAVPTAPVVPAPLFEPRNAAARVAGSATEVGGGLPREDEDFVGRVKQMCEVLWAFQSRSTAVLLCSRSNGRSATLRKIAQYANRRGRHFAGRCAFYPARAPLGGLLIVDDADEVLAAGKQHELLAHLQSHDARLLLACKKDDYDWNNFMGVGIKPYVVELPPLNDDEATELFLRSTYRPLTAADCSPQASEAGGANRRIMSKAEAHESLKDSISVLEGQPGRVRKAGVSVRPGSPPLPDLPRLVS